MYVCHLDRIILPLDHFVAREREREENSILYIEAMRPVD